MFRNSTKLLKPQFSSVFVCENSFSSTFHNSVFMRLSSSSRCDRPLARAATLQAHCHAAPRRDSGSADESRSNSSALSRKISPIVVGAGLFAGAGAGAAYFSSQRAKSLSGSFEDDSVGYEQPVTEPKAMGGEGFSMSSTSVSSSPEPGQTSANGDAAGSRGAEGAGPRELRLVSGVVMYPHPDKVAKGGEDAYFVAPDGRAIGVADGVGGWAEVGIDPGLYSKKLMDECRQAAEHETRAYDQGTPGRILHHAYMHTRVQGSATACIVVVAGDKLYAANLGDSGFVVIRGKSLLFQSPQQQHQFNFPYQLGSPDSMSDTPDKADLFTIDIAPGDVVVAGTDGLFDNVYPEEILSIVSTAKDEGWDATKTATRLAKYARRRAADEKYISPFAYGALSQGLLYVGGKQDDISVVVSYVQTSGTPAAADSDGAAAPATPEPSDPKSRL